MATMKNMKIAPFLLLVFVSSTYAEDGPITVQPDKGLGKLDLTNTNLTTAYCVAVLKECESDSHMKAFATTVDQMRARCNRDAECLAFYIDGSRTAHFHKVRCDVEKLVNSSGNQYYRLFKGETCPSGYKEHIEAKNIYSNSFCQMSGKSCPGHGIYRQPLAIKDFMECLEKCAKIMTCQGVNFQADKVDKNPCEPLDYQCKDDALVAKPSTTNYMRLKNDVTVCPDNRELPIAPPTIAPTTQAPEPTIDVEADVTSSTIAPTTQTPEPTTETVTQPPAPVACDKREYKYCRRSGKYCFGNYFRQESPTSVKKCQELCNKNCKCKSIHFQEQRRVCFLLGYVCTYSKLITVTGWNYYGKKEVGQDCNIP